MTRSTQTNWNGKCIRRSDRSTMQVQVMKDCKIRVIMLYMCDFDVCMLCLDRRNQKGVYVPSDFARFHYKIICMKTLKHIGLVCQQDLEKIKT